MYKQQLDRVDAKTIAVFLNCMGGSMFIDFDKNRFSVGCQYENPLTEDEAIPRFSLGTQTVGELARSYRLASADISVYS